MDRATERAFMKARGPTIDRVSRWVAVVASVWFAFAASWGMFGIPGSGHIGAGGAGNVMAAEQMIKWKILYPAWGWYNGVRPVEGNYICHHPFGQYYVPAVLYWLFGHHDVLVRLPAVLMSAAMPPMLYGIGKARWGAPVGAVAAAGYVFVPIALGFSDFWNLETICIFGALLFFWGHTRHLSTGRQRYVVASLVGLAFACAGDWVGYLLVAPTLVWAFLRAFVIPVRWTPRLPTALYARWWALSAILVVLSLVWWIGLFHHVKQIDEWLNAGTTRGGGDSKTLRATLDARKAWIDFSFTPLAIWIGKAAAPICLLRLFVTRLDEETYSLGLLFGATVQYVVFKEGADVHIFWPHYFAPYFALALAQLAGTVGAVVARVLRWFSAPHAARTARTAAVGAIVTLVVGLTPVAAMAHDGIKALGVWRRTGGRYDDNGSFIRSQIDMLFVMKHVIMPNVKLGTRLDVHPGAGWGWEQYWTYQGECAGVTTPAIGGADAEKYPFWLSRSSVMSGDEQRRIAASAHVRTYGDLWVVDKREHAAPLDAYSLNEREPNLFEWLFLDGTEPHRSIGSTPDGWDTWEWRTHLGQPATAPSGEPATLDQFRIAYNVAIAGGDKEGAARWRRRIEAQLDAGPATTFTSPAVRLIGVRVTGGAQPLVESWFECQGALGDASFNVRSTMLAREPLSWIPPDPMDRNMAAPPQISTKLWRTGFLYVTRVMQNHRVGREQYLGGWASRDGSPAPRRADGKPETTLAEIP
jgi:hypothetical protein